MAFRAYPKMIYHEDGSRKAVLNEDEYEAHLRKGWSARPVTMSEATLLKGKIDKMEEELRVLKMKLAAIENVNDVVVEAPSPEPEQAEEVFPVMGKRKPRTANRR